MAIGNLKNYIYNFEVYEFYSYKPYKPVKDDGGNVKTPKHKVMLQLYEKIEIDHLEYSNGNFVTETLKLVIFINKY